VDFDFLQFCSHFTEDSGRFAKSNSHLREISFDDPRSECNFALKLNKSKIYENNIVLSGRSLHRLGKLHLYLYHVQEIK